MPSRLETFIDSLSAGPAGPIYLPGAVAGERGAIAELFGALVSLRWATYLKPVATGAALRRFRAALRSRVDAPSLGLSPSAAARLARRLARTLRQKLADSGAMGRVLAVIAAHYLVEAIVDGASISAALSYLTGDLFGLGRETAEAIERSLEGWQAMVAAVERLSGAVGLGGETGSSSAWLWLAVGKGIPGRSHNLRLLLTALTDDPPACARGVEELDAALARRAAGPHRWSDILSAILLRDRLATDARPERIKLVKVPLWTIAELWFRFGGLGSGHTASLDELVLGLTTALNAASARALAADDFAPKVRFGWQAPAGPRIGWHGQAARAAREQGRVTLVDTDPLAAALTHALSANADNFAVRVMPSIRKLWPAFWAELGPWAETNACAHGATSCAFAHWQVDGEDRCTTAAAHPSMALLRITSGPSSAWELSRLFFAVTGAAMEGRAEALLRDPGALRSTADLKPAVSDLLRRLRAYLVTTADQIAALSPLEVPLRPRPAIAEPRRSAASTPCGGADPWDLSAWLPGGVDPDAADTTTVIGHFRGRFARQIRPLPWPEPARQAPWCGHLAAELFWELDVTRCELEPLTRELLAPAMATVHQAFDAERQAYPTVAAALRHDRALLRRTLREGVRCYRGGQGAAPLMAALEAIRRRCEAAVA